MRFKRLKAKKEVVKLRFQKMAYNFFMAKKSKFKLSRLSKSHSRKLKERFGISIIVTSVPNIVWSTAFWIFPWDSLILSVWPLVLPLSVGAEPLFTILSVCLFASLQTFVSKSQKFIFKTNKIDRRQIQPLNLPWRRPHGNRLARLPPDGHDLNLGKNGCLALRLSHPATERQLSNDLSNDDKITKSMFSKFRAKLSTCLGLKEMTSPWTWARDTNIRWLTRRSHSWWQCLHQQVVHDDVLKKHRHFFTIFFPISSNTRSLF